MHHNANTEIVTFNIKLQMRTVQVESVAMDVF